jgi:ribosomal protein S18 acetylase RimI-like enzyme
MTTNDDDIVLRFAAKSDLGSLVDFNLAMALETESKALDAEVLREGVRRVLGDSTLGFYVVAEHITGDTRQVVGSLMITYEWSDWRNALFWWIQSVYVTERFRRRGIYRRLYGFVKEQARAKANVCGFRLYVEKENLVAQQTYKNLGMDETHYLMFEEPVV